LLPAHPYITKSRKPKLRTGVNKAKVFYLQTWKEIFSDYLELIPGAENMLSDLKEKGFKLAILSNKDEERLFRACPQFNLSHIIEQAMKIMALKLRANFSNRVAILRQCLSLANRFSTRCRILYRYESNSGFGFLLLDFLGITEFIPASVAWERRDHPKFSVSFREPVVEDDSEPV
jgi:hypothetical protein